MPANLPGNIEVTSEGDRVTISIGGSAWTGTAAEAERVLTGLHYAIGRANPGINIGSMFLNGGLWGGKFVETDRDDALRMMRALVDRLGERIDMLAQEEIRNRN